MLLSYSVKNFRSIKDKVTINLGVKDEKELLGNNLYHEQLKDGKNVAAVNSVFLYGANASGKSNLLLSMEYFCDVMRLGNENVQKYVSLNFKNYGFAFDSRMTDVPTEFELITIIDGGKYKYKLSILRSDFLKESLYESRKNRFHKLYDISNGKLHLSEELNDDVRSKLRKIFDWAKGKSFLTAIAREQQKELGIYSKLWNSFALGIMYMHMPEYKLSKDIAAEFVLDKENKRKVLDLLRDADSTISDIIVKGVANRGYDVFFRYVLNNESFDVPFYDESTGTRQLFEIAPIIVTSMVQAYNDRILVIDELDNGLHPCMTKGIVELLLKKLKKVQLFASLHYTGILDILRRDQIILVEKDKKSLVTTISSIADYAGVRKDLKKEKAYLRGFFGATPYVTFDTFDEEEE